LDGDAFFEKNPKSKQQQHTENQHQKERMFDLTAQKRVELFGIRFLNGYQVFEEQEEKQPKSVCIIRCLF
jgi:hypothetical protein